MLIGLGKQIINFNEAEDISDSRVIKFTYKKHLEN